MINQVQYYHYGSNTNSNETKFESLEDNCSKLNILMFKLLIK